MSKIIENPSKLIDALVEYFWEDDREVIEQAISQYISDAVIAVTAEDIAAQAIAWANSHKEFYYDKIDMLVDCDRYLAIQNALIVKLDVKHICDYIETEWDITSSTSGEATLEALLERYDEDWLLNMISAIASNYNEAKI